MVKVKNAEKCKPLHPALRAMGSAQLFSWHSPAICPVIPTAQNPGHQTFQKIMHSTLSSFVVVIIKTIHKGANQQKWSISYRYTPL